MKKLVTISIALLCLTACDKNINKEPPASTASAPQKSDKSDPSSSSEGQKPLSALTTPTTPSAEPKVAIDNPPRTEKPNPPLIGRVWTSADGRTLEAELIARTKDTATLRRNSDQKEFALPLSNLSDTDRAYIASSSVPLTQIKTFDMARLNTLKAAMPTLTAIAPLDSSDPIVVDSLSKYKRSIQVLSTTGYSRSLEMIRGQIESDLKRLGPISGTVLKNPPILTPMGWSKGSGAWREVWAARSIIAWLNGPLNSYLSELEKIK